MRIGRRVSRSVRAAIPALAEHGVRRAVLRWGMVTARWRMRPDLVIAGAQRSGTTTLFRLFSEHPQVVRPTLSKGTAYFDLHYNRGARWYRGHFPLRVTGRLHARGRNPITFESCGYYMYHPLAPRRIATDLPGARVVVMLRDPVERAYSAHRHEFNRGFETLPFDSAIHREPERTAGESDRLRTDPACHSFEHQHHAYLGRGEYATQVSRLRDAVGAEKLYVMDAGAFFDDPAGEFARLCAWLGLDPPPPTTMSVWNAEAREAMSPALRDELTDYFEPFDAELERVLDRAPSWRSSQRTLKESGDHPL